MKQFVKSMIEGILALFVRLLQDPQTGPIAYRFARMSAISFDNENDVNDHLNRYSISRQSLVALGVTLVKSFSDKTQKHSTKTQEDLVGEFTLISEGFGSTTKFRFRVKDGSGDKAPIQKNYFIRIPHDFNQSKEQIEREDAFLSDPRFKSLISIYHPEDGEFSAESLDKKTKIHVGVFSWAHDRSGREMFTLGEFIQKNPASINSEFLGALTTSLIDLTTKFNQLGNNGAEVRQAITLNQSTLLPSYWVDLEGEFTYQTIESSNKPEYLLDSVCPVQNEKLILCLRKGQAQHWLQIERNGTTQIPEIGKPFYLDEDKHAWKSYHSILINKKFLPKSAVDGNKYLDDNRSHKFLRAVRHTDLHPGNILVGKSPDGTTDLAFIDFCDVDNQALFATDFAFLVFTLCLFHAKEALNCLDEIFRLLKSSDTVSRSEGNNSILFRVILAVKKAQDKAKEGVALPVEDVHFTYWFVAHKYLRYVMLEDRSDEYKEVVSRWMEFWDPEKNTPEKLVLKLNSYAGELASYWDEEKSKDAKKQPADRVYDERRLDCYVPPRLSWITRISDINWSNFSLEPLKGKSEEQPVMAFLECLKSDRRLLITERGGSGKSLLALKLASELSALRDDDGLSYLVFFWQSKLPDGYSILDLLLSDERYSRFCDDDGLLNFALERQRVVVILDGYDELKDHSRIEKFFRTPDKKLEKVCWILLGRQYGFVKSNDALGIHDNSRFSKWKCLSIEPFLDSEVDEYRKKAGINQQKWDATVDKIDVNERKLFLSLPSNVSSLARLIEHSDAVHVNAFIESGSDLFLQLFELSIKREIERHELSIKRKIDKPEALRDLDTRELEGKLSLLKGMDDGTNYKCIAEAVGCIAFHMACRGFYRAVEPSGNGFHDDMMKQIDEALDKRFKERYEFLKLLREILDGLIRDKWGIIVPKSPKIYAFNHRLTLEHHCAHFLAAYATAEDLSAAAEHVGNNAWNTIWSALIKMPLFGIRELMGQNRVLHGRLDAYGGALGLLFKRPDDTSEFRRPTRLMYEALSWLERYKYDSEGVNLRNSLIVTLRELQPTPSVDEAIVAAGLIEVKTPSSTTHLWLSKYPVLNSEYRLFDPVERPSDNAPAQLCSWYDAVMYCLFRGPIEISGQSHDFSLPFSSELMKCIDWVKLQQNGGGSDIDTLFCDYESKNFNFDHAKCDCMGLVGLFNSGFEWCLSQDRLRGTDESYPADPSSLPKGESTYDPWPNPYYIVPGLRPKSGRYNNVTFRLAIRTPLAKESTE